MSIELLKEEVLNCNKCGLAKTRNNVIFGEGNSHAPVLIIGEAPDNTAYASLMLAALGGGAVSSMKTTVLMTHEEGVEAFRRAGQVAYAPPGG